MTKETDEMHQHMSNCLTLLKDYFAQEKLNIGEILSLTTNIFMHSLQISFVQKKELKELFEEIYENYDEKGVEDILKELKKFTEKDKPNE